VGEIPGWIREQLQVEGWVVVESLETFDVHLGDRYADRAAALQKALAGDALLASRGKASLSRDLEGEFVIGKLRRSARPIESEGDERLLVYSLADAERHRMPTREGSSPDSSHSGPQETRTWTCPTCARAWEVLAVLGELPADPSRCPDCGVPPSEFTPGQVVRVQRTRTRLGVVDSAVRAECLLPDGTVSDVGPFTGEYMVWHLSEAYGSRAPADPDFEQVVFSNLPQDPARRRGLASLIMAGTSADPDQIEALEPEEEGHLLGA